MKIIALSDTHNRHWDIKVPSGDWLIHWPAASLDQRIQLSRLYMQHIVK
jgi:hypothetical protein